MILGLISFLSCYVGPFKGRWSIHPWIDRSTRNVTGMGGEGGEDLRWDGLATLDRVGVNHSRRRMSSRRWMGQRGRTTRLDHDTSGCGGRKTDPPGSRGSLMSSGFILNQEEREIQDGQIGVRARLDGLRDERDRGIATIRRPGSETSGPGRGGEGE
jgi:hypothetical protein